MERSGEPFPEVFQRPDWCDERLWLLAALAALSRKERAAVLLFELGGFSIEEIAAIQGERTLSSVKSRLSRARSRLRKLLLRSPALRLQDPDARLSTLHRTLDHETLDAINNEC